MRLAAVQFRPERDDHGADLDRLATHVRRACRLGAELVVTPEMPSTGYVFDGPDEVRPVAETAHGPTFRTLAPLAAEYETTIVAGFVEAAGDALFNAALTIAPTGELAGVYRKNLLFELDERWATAGEDRLTLDTNIGRVAPAICMDLNDDAFVTYLHLARPDVVAFCTNWLDQGFDVVPYWRYRLRGWAGWFVAANTWGTDRDVRFSGRSAVLGPDGRVAAIAAKTGDAVLVVDTEDVAG